MLLEQLHPGSIRSLGPSQQHLLARKLHMCLFTSPRIPLEAGKHHASGHIDGAIRPWSLDMCFTFVKVVAAAHHAMYKWCGLSELSDEEIDWGKELHLAVAFLGMGRRGRLAADEVFDALRLCVQGVRLLAFDRL